MPRYKLTIAYDGTHFCGWQKQEPYADAPELVAGQGPHARTTDQAHAEGKTPKAALSQRSALATGASGPNLVVDQLPIREGEVKPRVALRSVQHIVEQAVRTIVRERVTLDGASRTDAGVHARGQVGAFSCSVGHDEHGTPTHTGWPLERGTDRLTRALNARLPEDVLVTNAEIVDHAFDPISHCVSKAYSYTIAQGPVRPLFDRPYLYWLYEPLNAIAMHEAAQHLLGTHDFTSFAALHHGRATSVRTIHACAVCAQPSPDGGQRIRLDIAGSGFLYNMVRIIAGTLVEVGKGRLAPSHIPTILAALDRRRAGPTLAPQGLCLEWIRYA